MMIVNDDSGIINKLGASLTDDAKVLIYDQHMFIVQATECNLGRVFNFRYGHGVQFHKCKTAII